MRIAFVSHTPNLGGAERMLLNLARLFKNEPDICAVIVHPAVDASQPSGIGLLPILCDDEQIAHYPVCGTSNYIFINAKNRNRSAHEHIQYQNELEKAFVALAVDAVLVNTLTSAAPVMAARTLGLPAVVWVHGILDTYLIDKQYDATLRLLIDRILINLCDETICCSAWTARYYEAVTQKSLRVIPNWTDTVEPLKPIPEGCADFVCLTTLDVQKGVYVLLDAASRLRDQKRRFLLRIYGDGIEQKRIIAYINEHQMSNMVILSPRVQEVDSVYNNAMCVIQPSYIESFGLTVLEGMAHGRPVIAVASGGPCELIEDGVTGFLVPRGDSAAIADKMAYLLDHADEAREMGRKGNARYQKVYSPTKAKACFTELFGRLCQRNDTESDFKPLLDDTLAYIFRAEDAPVYQEQAAVLRLRQAISRFVFKVRKRLGRIKRKLLGRLTSKQYIHGMEEVIDGAVNNSMCLSQASMAMKEPYEALADRPPFEDPAKLKLLIIYPDQAIATYAIAIQEPLDYIKRKRLCDIVYDAKDIAQVATEDMKDYDIIICVRFFHEAAHKLALAAKALEKCFIWYIDDNYSTKTLAHPTAQQSKNVELFESMFTDSYAVMVNNPKLKELGDKLGANVILLPTYQLITNEINPIKQADAPIRFGFFGTLGRDDDFSCVTPAIVRILQEYPRGKVEVEFIGYVPPQLATMPNVKGFEFMFDYRAFRSFFASRGWDFALAPLKNTLFNQSKTNNKYREYSSLSIPAIFSKVGPYLASIRNEDNGLLVDNTTDEWYNAIKRMVEDKNLRNRMGKKAFEDIVTNYSIRHYASQMLAFMKCSYRGNKLDGASFYTEDMVKKTNQRSVLEQYMCTSRALQNNRRYWITLCSPVIRTLKVFLTSYTGQCDGTIAIELYHRGRLIAVSKALGMADIVYNAWTSFDLQSTLSGYDMAIVELRFVIRYASPHRLCVYEDTRKRTFIYKVCNKLHLNGAERNVIIVDES